MKKFTITKEHLKLLKRLNVYNYNNLPQIDQYRPYGNSDYLRDIAEILGYKLSKDKDGNEFISAALEKKMTKMHHEMIYVLQICLQFLQFKEGKFEQSSFGIWKKIK